MTATFVIPCFNEAARLPVGAFETFVATHPVTLLFVDDGSTDDTLGVLRALRERAGERVVVHALAQNVGKGEAVRAGLREALARGASIVAYLDADLATPLEEMRRLLEILERDDAIAALTGARVALNGRNIERTTLRHYAGRLFATCAAIALHVRYYDTQCGAKLFRANAALADALVQPFGSPWLFDVELLGRLLSGPHAVAPDALHEEPLREWRDVAGTRLNARVFLRAPYELARISAALRERRRRA